MGAVWYARDLRLRRPVAVKVATAPSDGDGSGGQARRRLRREAAALAAVSEPRIARVYDLIDADRDVCLVMELVDGESLDTRLDRQPRLPALEALEIAGQCAQALEAAHRLGIVHRDVKPSNIMLGPGGVKVVDFGLAAHVDQAHADTTRTMSTSLVGTAAYFAPERALGSPAGPAADFYALGVVLYRMLAGHLPYRAAEPIAMLYAHATAMPEPLPADVPAPAAALCSRLLEKRPEKRPTSAADFAAACNAISDTSRLEHVGAPAVQARWGFTWFDRLVGTGRGLAALFGVLFATVAVLIAATAWVLLGQSAHAGTAVPAPTLTSVSNAPAGVVLPSSRPGQRAIGDTPSAKPSATAPVHSGGGHHGRTDGGGKHGDNGTGD